MNSNGGGILLPPTSSQQQPLDVTSTPDHHPTHLRQLQFWFGAPTDFKVYESIATLQYTLSRPDLLQSGDIDEQAGLVHDASRVLIEARAVQQKHNIKHEDLNALAQAIGDLKVRLRPRLTTKLNHLTDSIPQPLNDVTLSEWRARCIRILDFSASSADGSASMPNVDRIRRDFNHLSADLYREVREHKLTADPATQTPRLPDAETVTLMAEAAEKIPRNSNLTENDVQAEIESIIQLYYMLCSVLTMSTQSFNTNFDNLINIFTALRPAFIEYLSLDQNGRTLLERRTDSETRTRLQGWSHGLVSQTDVMVRQVITQRFQSLQQMTTQGTDLSRESDFTSLAKIAESMTFPTPNGVSRVKWSQCLPRMLRHEQYQILMNKLQFLHAEFQDRTYRTNETRMLWLNIWRGIKATYLLIRDSNFQTQLSADKFPAEHRFFQRRTVLNQMEHILSGPDALYPIEIENAVAEFCLLIAQCQQGHDPVYQQLRNIGTAQVTNTICHQVEAYVTVPPTYSDDAINAMETCAVRLNSLLGGPSFVRRWSRQANTTGSLNNQWTFDTITAIAALPPVRRPQVSRPTHSDSDLTSSSSDSDRPNRQAEQPPVPRAPLQLIHGGILTPPPTNTTTRTQRTPIPTVVTKKLDPTIVVDDPLQPPAVPEMITVDNSVANAHPEPYGINVVSGFDYVNYPFPETRAIEVAQSRQISREMSQRGIYSEGTLAQDVVYIAPRHTWTPGSISIWAQPLPIAPLDVVKELWSLWRHGRPQRKALRQPRHFPSITPRSPRRDWLDEHPRLGLMRQGNRNRITKPASRTGQRNHDHHDHHNPQHHHRRHSHDHARRMPILRGGGPKAGPANSLQTAQTPQNRPIKLVSSPTNVAVDDNERNRRLNQLVNRLRGVWRQGQMLSPALIQTNYLIPNNWDVDAAYIAAIQDRNQEALPDAGFVQEAGRQLADPFRRSGLNRRTRFLLTGPSGKRVPVGRRSYVEPISSPTPVQPSHVHHDVFNHARLTPTLQAHRLLGPFRPATPGATAFQYQDAQEILNRHSDLSDSFVIYEDPPNREHEHNVPNTQIESNMSPASNVENRPPVIQQPPGPSSVLVAQSSQIQAVQQGRCDGQQCHPCPRYSGLYHHICAGQRQTTSLQFPSSPPARPVSKVVPETPLPTMNGVRPTTNSDTNVSLNLNFGSRNRNRQRTGERRRDQTTSSAARQRTKPARNSRTSENDGARAQPHDDDAADNTAENARITSSPPLVSNHSGNRAGETAGERVNATTIPQSEVRPIPRSNPKQSAPKSGSIFRPDLASDSEGDVLESELDESELEQNATSPIESSVVNGRELRNRESLLRQGIANKTRRRRLEQAQVTPARGGKSNRSPRERSTAGVTK